MTTQAPAAAPPKEKTDTSAGSPVKKALTMLAVAAVAVGAAYGTGRYQGHQSTQAAEQKRDDIEKQKAVVTGEFDAQRDRAIRLEARRRLHMAQTAVDEKNFGIAHEHLAKAAALLARAKGVPALDALAADLKTTNLAPGAQPNQSRDKVTALIRRFDEAQPPAE